ncbi:MAG: hypothetical protein ACD_45C00217G0018 [uncultured bacterium]|nr:MAG: hypothetical protein ACD_45C00217G0018 [uncultured bacterium]
MMIKGIVWILGNFSFVMLVLAVVLTILQKIKNKKLSLWEILYRWIALFALGIMGIYGFIMHAFFPDISAATIGWQNSPFQYEVAIANLGFGLIALLSFRAAYPFRLASVIGNACWLWGDAVGHIYQMISQHNFATGNAGTWFWTDVLVPLLAVICIVKLKHVKGIR